MSDLKNVKLHYFSSVNGSRTMGRGENVRLFLKDAGIDFEYIRYDNEQWEEVKKKLLAQKIYKPTMSYITIDGKYYGKTAPILKFLSRKLNKYNGDNEDEAQLLDVYTDMVNDWINEWVHGTFGNPTNEVFSTYKDETCPEIFEAWENILSNTKGPFLLGANVSYADFCLFHMLEDDTTIKVSHETYPRIISFIEAMNNRPNLKKYLITDRF